VQHDQGDLMAKLVPALAVLMALAGGVAQAQAAASGIEQEANAALAPARTLYEELHQHPELSAQESRTAARLAGALREIGYTVTEHVGGTGIVAILDNGPGPTIMLRTELDALPVAEATGLPYASTVLARNAGGEEVPVMHACGHDLHMASLVGTAGIMAGSRQRWRGRLILIGQPAEETIAGAKAMIRDGLFTRFPKPDVALALHVNNELPAGQVGVAAGPHYASADSLRITIYGRGGHGASPHTTVDPIVIAARTVLALQTIASREVRPGEMAVVTVGTLHAGLKNNIIPDQAVLGLTVRSYKPEIRRLELAAIARIVKAEAEAGGAPKAPLIEHFESTDSVANDAGLVQRLRAPLEVALGADNVHAAAPISASEDFSEFLADGVPGFDLDLGGANAQEYATAAAAGTHLPSNHSPFFHPDAEPALRTAMMAEVTMLRTLMGKP
jgi:hippurate hydrolase